MFKKNFIGQEGFVWWLGIIENRIDPLRVGRCQVRIFGWHTDEQDIDTNRRFAMGAAYVCNQTNL